MNIRTMQPEERLYTYPQSLTLQSQTGSIGYLRGDFGSPRGCFFCWNEVRRSLQTEEFQNELEALIQDQRKNGFLKDQPSMRKLTDAHPESGFQGEHETEYGFRVDQGEYAYLFRLSENQSECHFFCWCFQRESLDRHLAHARQGIRFVSTGYREKFRIPDGGRVSITNRQGQKKSHACRYLDDYHVELNGVPYHIHELAELLDGSGATCEPTQEPKKLQKERVR
jgi:hypothetical protein